MAKLAHIDTETGSVDAEKAALLQLSIILDINGPHAPLTRNWFIQPEPGLEVTDRALEIQKVTREQIMLPPYRPIREVFPEVLAFLGSKCDKFNKADKYTMVGYNVRYDEAVMRALWQRMGDLYYGSWFWTPPIDVMVLLAQIYLEIRAQLPNFQLGTLLARYNISSPGNLHDSRTDICGTRQLYYRALGQQIGPVSWTGTSLCSICGEPQISTPHGLVCSNGHGGADSIEPFTTPHPDQTPPMTVTPEQFYDRDEYNRQFQNRSGDPIKLP